MTGIFILLGGMAAFAIIITTLDALTQRHDRNKAALLRETRDSALGARDPGLEVPDSRVRPSRPAL